MNRTHKYLTLSLFTLGLALFCLPLAGRSQSPTGYWSKAVQTLRTSFGTATAVSNSKTSVTPASPIVAAQAQKQPCLSYAECARTQTQLVESTSSQTTTRRTNRASTEAIMTLYDQTNNVGGFDITYQDFEAGLDAFDNEAADDFVVPAPGWQIQRIEIPGSFVDNGGGLGAPTIDVTFYSATGATGNTLPNAVLYTFPAVIPTANVNGNFTLDLPGGGASFPPGTYWMQLQVNYPSASGQYFWGTRSVKSNSGAVWRQPGNGSLTGATNFTRLPDVGGVGVGGLGTLNPDLLFRLSGTLAPNLTVQAADPAVCLDPGGLVGVTATVTNPNNTTLPATFTATLPTGLTALAGTCAADVNPGGCAIAGNGGSVTWNGQLNPGQTVTIIYRARIAANVGQGAQLTITNTANVDGAMTNFNAVVSVNCPNLTNTRVSDQKAGSLLVFPYYTSTIGGASDTRMTISNISNAASTTANQAYVHLFFIEGTTCQQADVFVCLTPGASISFKASEYDPGNTGYLLAVAVDRNGVPVQNNVLIGNAFVRTPTLADNYGAESFWANTFSVALVTGNTATLFFDQAGYDAVPKQFAVEIQSPVDAVGQQVIAAGLSGDLNAVQITGAAQVGTAQAFNEKEQFASFQNWLTGTCQARGTITTNSPRVPNGLGTLIKTGQAGHLKFNVGAAVGVLLTPRGGAWTGIRTLHKTQTTTTTLTIPIFVPVC